jgi:Mrp family chromosome partitioning ATPase
MNKNRTCWIATTSAALALGLALTGCSVSVGGLDMAKAQTEIAKGIEEQTGATGVTVTCPESAPLEQGNTFTCTATTADGQTATVTVTQTDDQGNINWEVTDVSP